MIKGIEKNREPDEDNIRGIEDMRSDLILKMDPSLIQKRQDSKEPW
jgi:hypothetical protein